MTFVVVAGLSKVSRAGKIEGLVTMRIGAVKIRAASDNNTGRKSRKHCGRKTRSANRLKTVEDSWVS